jgi:hypothetical protein
MNESRRFSWLHLSDFHSGMAGANHFWPTFEGQFFKDLRQMHELSGPWDAIFFTGDLAQSGKADEYNRLTDFLGRLYSSLKQFGSNPTLYVVPGNHDLMRPDADSAVVKVLSQWSKDANLREKFWNDPACEYRQSINQAFANYTSWLTTLPFNRPADLNPGAIPGDFASTEVYRGLNVGVVGLNSAFLQLTGRDYRRKLTLDVQQMTSVFSPTSSAEWLARVDLAFLLTHHPPAWLKESDQSEFFAEINPPGRFVAHLFGHEHAHDHSTTAHGGGQARRHWQAASLFGLEKYGTAKKHERRHGYSTGTIVNTDDEKWAFRLYPRLAVRHQAGHLHLVDDTSFTLDRDHGTPVELLDGTLLARAVVPTVIARRPIDKPVSIIIISTDTDLLDARRQVADHLKRALGVRVDETPSPSTLYDICVLLQGWRWDSGLTAALWSGIMATCRLAFVSDANSDWPPRRLAEFSAQTEVEAFRGTLKGKHTFDSPHELPELVAECVTEYVQAVVGTETVGLNKCERSYLDFRLPAWKAGRTAASAVHLVDSSTAEELYQSDLYIPLEGVSARWSRSKNGQPVRLKKPKGKSAQVVQPTERRIRLGRWVGIPSLPRIAVVGAPGGGKTVFLTRIASAIANACLGRPVDLEPDLDVDALRNSTGALPIPVVLEATRIARHPTVDVRALLEVIADEMASAGERPETRSIETALHEGRYILFVDALDEIADAAGRAKVLDLFKGIAAANVFPKTNVLLTTRSARYTGALRFAPEFEIVNVAPLSGEQVRQFCKNWSNHRTKDEEYRQSLMVAVAGLSDRVGTEPEDQGLTENPLMLTAICMLFERYRSLPDDRGRLCDLLIDDLCRSRPSEDTERRWKLDDAAKKDLLQRIAMGMQEEGAQEWPVSRAIEIVLATLPSQDEHRQQRAKRYLDWTADHTGLLRFHQADDGKEQVRFWHRLFREYLSATRVAQLDNTATEKINDLWQNRRLQNPFWEDVVRLLPRALGTIEKARSVRDTLTQLASANDLHQGRLLGLAMAAVIENRDLYPEVDFRKAAQEMAATYERTGLEWPTRDRVLFLEALGRIDPLGGDPRVANHPWVEVTDLSTKVAGPRAAQHFSYGWAQVTVHEFLQFAQSADAGKEFLWDTAVPAQRELLSWLRGQLRHPNWPVVGVTFEHAVAFCRWRTHQRRDGLIVRLATMDEYISLKKQTDKDHGDVRQRSVRGRTRRIGIGPNTPVGTFAPNSFGLVDFGDAVWEWLADGPQHGEYEGTRALGGGSHSGLTFVPTREDFRHSTVGFRCVLASPNSAGRPPVAGRKRTSKMRKDGTTPPGTS